MYSVIDYNDTRILRVMQGCSKKFTVGGSLVKLDKNGLAFFPSDNKIAVCKVKHHTFHKIFMAKNKQLQYHNSTILQHELGETIPLDMEEILLASLEVVEVL